jgi:hypothetical protein
MLQTVPDDARLVSCRQNALLANASRFIPRGLVVHMMMQVTKQRGQSVSQARAI